MAYCDSTLPGCVVLAAGSALRFGENKLHRQLDGVSLIQRTLDAIPMERLCAVVVVTQYESVAALARSRGFAVVENHLPQEGLSRSVRLGTEALSHCEALLYLVADQPLLRRESVQSLLSLHRRHPEKIAALAHGGVRGNPCLFPQRFFPELMALEGDIGGSAVIRRHPQALILCETPARELWDVDTPQALERLKNL